MAKLLVNSPVILISRRKSRAQKEWKVLSTTFFAGSPISFSARFFISPAALFVKVIAKILNGEIPCAIKFAIL